MKDDNNSIHIKLMGRSFKVKCPEDSIAQLQESAAYLNAKMYEIADSSKISGIDSVAAVAALNITHELKLEKQNRQDSIEEMHVQIQHLQNKIERALAGEG